MKVLRIFLTALFCTAACIVLPTGLSKTSAVSMVVAADTTDYLKIYLDGSAKNPAFSELKSSDLKEIPTGKEKKVIYGFPGEPPASSIRFDPGEYPGVVRVYGMGMQQALGRRFFFDAKEIFDGFRPGREGMDVTLHDDYLEIVSTVEDPFMVSQPGFLPKPRPFWLYLPIALLTLFFYRFLGVVDGELLRRIFLPKRKLRAGIDPIAPLDGLRGMAIILVVADHTWGWFTGAGAGGVLIFFVLSGFLLARPFVTSPQLICKPQNLLEYGERRLQRILPMYYLYLFLTFGLSLRLYELFLHLFFVEALGHLWAIPQEMAFYTVFPLIIFINYYLLRGKVWAIIPALLLMVFGWHQYVSTNDIFLYGMLNTKLDFKLDVFLVGVLCSYLYFGVWQQKERSALSLSGKWTAVTVAVGLFVLFFCFSNGNLLQEKRVYSQDFHISFAAAAGLLILLLTVSGENLLNGFLSSSLLSSLGVVSYSLYLFHPLVIQFVKHSGGRLAAIGPIRFALVLLLSYIVACLLHYFVERPLAVIFAKQKQSRELKV